MRELTFWVPGRLSAGVVVVTDAATGAEVAVATLLGAIELPDGAGGWRAMPAARGVYTGWEGAFAVVRFASGAVVRTRVLWGNQFFDGRRPSREPHPMYRRTAGGA